MNYRPLELGPKCPVACPNLFTEESTLICPGSRKIIIQVAGENRAIVQLGLMQQGKGVGAGAVVWQEPEPFLGGVAAALSRNFDAVRVRNWEAGKEAEVFITVA